MAATAAVRIPIDDFERSRLPRVCVLSGEPADGWTKERFDSPIGAQYWLLLLGLVPFVIVRAVTKRTAQGRLPVTGAAFASLEEQRKRRTLVTWACGVGGLGACVLGVVASSADVVVLGLLLVAVGIVLLGAAVVVPARTPSIRGHVERDGRWVVVENAHPTFVTAIDAFVRAG